MNDLPDKVVDALEKLSVKLAEPATQIWEATYRYVLTTNIVQLIIATVLALISATAFKYCRKEEEKKEEESPPDMIFIVGIVIGIVAAWAGIDAIVKLLNVEFYTIQKLIDLVP